MKKNYLLIAIIFCASLGHSQIFTNSGAKINIATGVYLTVNDLENKTTDEDGEIFLDGNLQISGDIINSSNGNMFADIEENPDGNIILSGKNKLINGNNPIFFENISISDNRTIENNLNCIFGVLEIKGIIDLNSKSIIIKNNSENAINYSEGYILSETSQTQGCGIIKWEIGENSGSYNIPFGSGNSNENDLNISAEITNPGNSENGFINFATYPTNNQNTPLPNDVISLNDFTSDMVADRFWLIEPSYTENPDLKIALSYTNNDISEIANSNISIIRYNPNENSWSDLTIKTANTDNLVSADIKGSDIFKWFSIASENIDLTIPNGITPNNDNYNDTWIIEGCSNCSVYIYNRWGNKIYYSENYDNSWDGGNNPSGAYYYIITTPDNKTYKGTVNIMR